MSALTLDEVKNYLRVDGTDMDAEVTSYLVASESYVKRATGKEYYFTNGAYVDIAQDEVFKQCQLLQILRWFNKDDDNRIEVTLSALLGHIEMCGDYYETTADET